MNAKDSENALTSPVIEVPFPKLERWAGNTGIPYVSTFVSAKAGPHVGNAVGSN